MFHLSHHPWFFQDHDRLATAVAPAAREVCVFVRLCVRPFRVLSVHIRERQWKNENRSFMAKSWEEQISPPARFPACVSLWLAKMELHASTQPSQSSIISHSHIYTFGHCLPHISLWACRAPVVNSIFELDCAGPYAKIPDKWKLSHCLTPILQRPLSSSPSYMLKWVHISAPDHAAAPFIVSNVKPSATVFRRTIPTVVQRWPVPIKSQYCGCLVQMIVCYCLSLLSGRKQSIKACLE